MDSGSDATMTFFLSPCWLRPLVFLWCRRSVTFSLGSCSIRSHWTLKKCLLGSVWVIQAPTRPRVTFKWTPQAKFILWQTKFVPVSSDQLCVLCCFSEYFSRTQKQRDSVLNKPNLEEKALRQQID